MKEPEPPTCETCPYWISEDNDDEYRECHRLPGIFPTASMIDTAKRGGSLRYLSAKDATWPLSNHGDTCGEHPEFSAYIASLKQRKPPESPSLAPEIPVPSIVRELIARNMREAKLLKGLYKLSCKAAIEREEHNRYFGEPQSTPKSSPAGSDG